jgi:hypothetical protein
LLHTWAKLWISKSVDVSLKCIFIHIKVYNLIFNILWEWDPLKIILSIWRSRSHVIFIANLGMINTRLYFKRVVFIKMKVCWVGELTHLGWVHLNESNMLVNLSWVNLNKDNMLVNLSWVDLN